MDCCNCQCPSRKQENMLKHIYILQGNTRLFNKMLLVSLTYLYEHVKNNLLG